MDPAPLDTRPTTLSGPLGWLRDAWVLVAGWTVLAVVMTTATVIAFVTFRYRSSRYLHLVGRIVGKAVLWLGGVRLRVINPERLGGRKMRLVAFNHTSQLDMFIFGSLLPPGSTAVAKREFLRVPFIGWLFFAFKVPCIDRRNPQKARASMAEVGRVMKARQSTVFIAPEGTRSRDGRLAPFKMGLFHLAAETEAPIVPAIVRGAAQCQPMGRLVPRPGVIEVELLEELDTRGLSERDLHAERDRLQQIFAAALESRGGGGSGGTHPPRRQEDAKDAKARQDRN